jgi:hypothetical protein
MKKIILFAIVILGITTVPSCKKGEDDPFISFRSRDARITAKWKLVSLEEVSIVNGNTISRVLNGSILTSTNGGVSSTNSYTKEMEIKSDGTFNTTTTFDGEINTFSLFWYWYNDTNKKTGIDLDASYVIDRLSHNELVLRSERTSTSQFDGSINSFKNVYKYERK